jgi:hypothetical protein
MKINELLTELVGVKQSLATNDYKTALINQGFTPLGSGSFATVWAHPKLDYVLKTFSATDKAYMQWLKASLQLQGNPFVPRFISAKPVQVVPGILAIRMEKLEPTGNAKDIIHMISELIDECTIDAEDEPVVTPHGISNVMKKRYPDLVPFAVANKGLIPVVASIVEIIAYGAGVNDITNGDNVMMRGQQLVFTDPV